MYMSLLDLLQVLWGIMIIGIVGQYLQLIARAVVLHAVPISAARAKSLSDLLLIIWQI